MKILYLTPNVPQVPGTGSEMREFYLIQYLAGRHDFHVVCPERKREAEARGKLAGMCRVYPVPLARHQDDTRLGRLWNELDGRIRAIGANLQRWFNPPEHVMYSEFLRRCRFSLDGLLDRDQFDLVEFQHSQLFPLLEPFLDRLPVIANLHEVYSAAWRRGPTNSGDQRFQSRYARFWQNLEGDILRRADLTVTMSELETRRCRTLSPHAKCKVVSNGTDPIRFSPPKVGKRAKSEIVFCGLMNYGPNIDAVRFFSKEIFPRIRKRIPDCRFTIVGKNPTRAVQALGRCDVEVTGWVDDVVPYLQRCSVFVAPLRSGGGMRLKILDALASGAPVVTTPIGCEGIGLENGREALIRDDPESFAQAAVDLMDHPEKGIEMGGRGRLFVERGYDWKLKAEHMGRAYEEAVANFQKRKAHSKNGESKLVCAAS